MGHQCCSKQKVKRGLWSPEEDEKLIKFITTHGHSSWSSVPKLAGLQRCGKSCRLRWINYLRPDLKRGSFTAQEEMMIVDIHRILGNKWAQIAKHLPGRTDNEVKNFWNSCIKKKLIAQGLDPNTHNLLPPNYNKQTHHNNNINPCKPTSVFTISTTTTTTSPNQDFFMDVKLPLYPPTSVPPPDVVNSSCPPSFHISSNQNPNPIGSVRTSCSTSFPSGFGIIDENCFWSDPIIQHEEKTNDFSTGKNSIDACFDQYSNFDFDFMDSTLMSSSPLDQLTWDSSHLLS